MEMTSDAKIGLLLGLIFIFIIAFILNGLPGLHGKANSNQATAQDLSNLSSSATDTAIAQPAGVASGIGAPAGGEGDVRYKMSLTGGTAGAVANGTGPASQLGAGCQDPNKAAPKTAMAGDKSGLVDLTGSGAAKPVESTMVSDVAPAAVATAAEETKKSNEYTIVSGDTPAKIAVKAYGSSEGNRLVNINKIMSANKIKDPTKLVVGKKLTIPALPAGPAKLVATNPETFTTVDSTAPKSEVKAAVADVKPETKPAAGTKEYVVVKGDSLWTISAKTLGNGNRYKEILKLNSQKLGKDGSKLSLGMKLQIPAQQ
jgi:nucleoid-associated protein YgaU